MPQKPSIRVRVSDGKPREWKKLKAALGTFVDVRQDGPATCFRLATHTERQLTDLRPKLAALGLGARWSKELKRIDIVARA